MLDSPAAGFKTTTNPHSNATTVVLVICLIAKHVMVAESDHINKVKSDEITAAYSIGAKAASFPMIRGITEI